MTELDLYKFLKEHNFEFHWHNDDVVLFISVLWIEEWNTLLGASIMDEEGIKCYMKHGYFCFDMKDICDYFDIELQNVFPKIVTP